MLIMTWVFPLLHGPFLKTDPVLPGAPVDLVSPKFESMTNFITRRRIYFPEANEILTSTITENNIPNTAKGTLKVMNNINGAAPVNSAAPVNGAAPVNVPNFSPNVNAPFTASSSGFGQPLVISRDKTSIGTIAGFQGTITRGITIGSNKNLSVYIIFQFLHVANFSLSWFKH